MSLGIHAFSRLSAWAGASTVLSLLSLPSAVAQGTISISNDFVPAGRTRKAYVAYRHEDQYAPVPKDLYRIEVLDQTGLTISPNPGPGNPFYADGLFDLGTLVIPGRAPGERAAIIIQVWDSRTGGSYDTANLRQQSIVSLSVLGGNGIPTPTLAEVSDFVGISIIIPEPTPFALSLLSIAGLWFALRRSRASIDRP